MANGYAGAENEGPVQAQQNRRDGAYELIVNITDRKRYMHDDACAYGKYPIEFLRLFQKYIRVV